MAYPGHTRTLEDGGRGRVRGAESVRKSGESASLLRRPVRPVRPRLTDEHDADTRGQGGGGGGELGRASGEPSGGREEDHDATGSRCGSFRRGSGSARIVRLRP